MYRKLNNWKSTIESKIDKGKGKYHINWVAEEAIYQVTAEHAEAHHRRHGELETVYVDEQVQRLQSTDVRRIANEALRKLNCRLIKSKETVRSFDKPRNRRSRQAKQHSGKRVWSFTRSEKKQSSNRHIHIHYNRAHVKKYTRLLFRKESRHLNRGLRIAIEDKAYLKCGTREGFSRPLHKPVQII